MEGQQQGFVHRGFLGWVRDLASDPRPGQPWPVIDIDQRLIRDYDRTASILARDGINTFEIWGLLASHAYPEDIGKARPGPRIKQAKNIIQVVHKHGIKVLAGTGLYSWGFDAIVKAHPEIGCSNSSQLANPTLARSWEYQKEIIDALLSLGVDGLELQPGDQGRCSCPSCQEMGDTASYFGAIILQAVDYVHRRYPGKMVWIGGYGIDLSHPSDVERLGETLRRVEVYTDVGDSTQAFRKQLVRSMQPADLAGIAAPGVSPPQHLARDHWFLPTFQHQIARLHDLNLDGGTASENFMRVLSNPSDEISMRMVARYESHSDSDWRQLLRDLVVEIYRPKDERTVQQLCEAFVNAESAYFDHAQFNETLDIELEPLIGTTATPLTYLTKNMTAAGRAAYRSDLTGLLSRFESLRPRIRNRNRIDAVIRCLRNVIQDIDSLS